MQRRVIKNILTAILILFIIYNSVYFRRLSEVKAEKTTNEFDARAYAEQYWEKEIVPASSRAIDFSELLKQLKQNPEQAFLNHSHALGIGNIRYFMVKGEGVVLSINENDVTVAIAEGTNTTQVILATEFIYGNAIRDAVGAINLNEFTNTTHLNNVSAEINKKIRQQIIPPFKQQVKNNASVRFAGAIELNQKFLDLTAIEVLPASIELNQ